ncbi:hypothetical protein [Streptomyces triticiradicis]|uniref:Integral membrane protein n=1 Tax=Streptomyces triticiradicis TaxID=2651189 RepID=A0A7J5DBX4_9ACTN|nr:hypothetical protein [Streptomyces triticiradicis]KAB1986324.1 hypothetical protein F8144_23335 [Streptomyces triticiradicis]
MYGHGGTPPIRGAVTVIALRVLYASPAILSWGLFACVPLFRVAVQRGRWFDWVAAWASLPVSFGALVVVGTVPESDSRGDVALTVALLLGVGSAAYYLIADIRLRNAWRRSMAYAPPHTQTAREPYGFPRPAPPAPPYPGVLMSQPQPQPQPQPFAPWAYPPEAPVPQRPPQRVAPARIDQVRAELDELSDYLRKHGDRHDGDHGGGR